MEKPACVKGFSVFSGLSTGFIYARRVEVANGIMADDPNLGGVRVKGESGVGGVAIDNTTPQQMGAAGWFTGLILEIEPMPNSDKHELDFMEKKDLYDEFKMDMSAAGTVDAEVASYPVWHRVWTADFANLKIREHRAVDSKDKVRAELRRLLRRGGKQNSRDRAYYRGLRAVYHGSIRRERIYYWEYRLRPVKDPLLYLSYIQDGASQKWYQVPRYIDVDCGRDGMKFKLVGNLFHGHCLVLHIVMPHMPDNANLFCHCLDTSLEALIDVRKAKDQPE